jgi:hypothetical protein
MYSSAPAKSATTFPVRPTTRDGRALHRVARAIEAAGKGLAVLQALEVAGNLSSVREQRGKVQHQIKEAFLALDELYESLGVPVGSYTDRFASEVSDRRRIATRRKKTLHPPAESATRHAL